jgi:hypothetical protein
MAWLSDNDLIYAIGNDEAEREDWSGRLGEMRKIIAANGYRVEELDRGWCLVRPDGATISYRDRDEALRWLWAESRIAQINRNLRAAGLPEVD